MAQEATELLEMALQAKYKFDPESGLILSPQGISIGSVGSDNYCRFTVYETGGTRRWTIRRARAIFWYVHGYWPKEIDHNNRVRTDDRIDNLFDRSHSENMANRSWAEENGLPIGVRFKPRMKTRKYMAQYKDKPYGFFETAEEAHQAYLTARQKDI